MSVGLETLRSLQARFLSAVHDGRWSDAQEIQERRFAVMDLLLDEDMTPALTTELYAILAMDQDVMPEIERARGELAEKLRSLSASRKAMTAYTTP